MNCNTTISPSDSAQEHYLQLMAEGVDPDALLRSSGEAVARYDTAWKTLATRREDATQAVADFLLIAGAHIDALEICGARRPAMATMLSLLVSVDMSKADVRALAPQLIELHARYFAACLELKVSTADDSYAAPHADAILAIEARLFEAAAAGSDDLRLRGLLSTARAIPAPTHLTVDPAAPTEALVDMFSRFNRL